MRRPILSLFALSAAACAPQSAVLIEGDYTAYLSASKSITYQKGSLKLLDFERSSYVDCREFDAANNDKQNEELRLGDGVGAEKGQRLPICPGDDGANADLWPPTQETWLADDGYAVVGETLAPWRGEAVVTSEGDIQIGFHQRMPGGEDFWFFFAIDPKFQPRECVQNAAGDGVSYEPVNGDWLGEWSKDLSEEEGGGRLFYLNSSSYQLDPQGVKKYYDYFDSPPPGEGPPDIREWFLPNEWLAGHAEGRFSDDQFRLRVGKYGNPASYASYQLSQNAVNEVANISLADIYYWPSEELTGVPEAQDDTRVRRCLTIEDCVDSANEAARVSKRELINAGVPDSDVDGDNVDDLPRLQPRVHDNAWREPDASAAGLDGWVEMHYNWVRFDEGSELEVGGAATGEFNLVFEATESSSTFLVRGRFEVPKFKKDKWTTQYLPPVKYEQNGTDECGTAPQ